MTILRGMSLKKELSGAERIPFGWGYCRPSLWRQDTHYFAPIPLNFIIGGAHWFYWRVLVRGLGVRRDGFSDLRRRWIEEGFRRGESDGYARGLRHAAILSDPALRSDPKAAALPGTETT